MIMGYKDPEVERAYQKIYQKKYWPTYHREHPYDRMFNRIKSRAKHKKLPMDIDAAYIKEIWPDDDTCPALGIKFKVGVGQQIDSSPSLDRIVPKLGYIKDNVQIVCNLANKIMTDATPDQVIKVGYYFKKIVEKKNAA